LKPCTAQGTDCAGDIVTVCDGFNLSEYNCAALGGTCSKTGGSARCKRPADGCTPFDPGLNKCTGTQISLCIGGKPATFDCASVSKQCVAGAGAQSSHCG
jgi:hypothetical protein